MRFIMHIVTISLILVSGHALPVGIHTAPIILIAKDIRAVQFHPLEKYRLFITDSDGQAKLIPFQIDERDKYADFVLDKGPVPNSNFGNGIFDFNDELVFMGNDVGSTTPPTKWNIPKPNIIYQINFDNQADKRSGAIFVGIYFGDPPPMPKISYVHFDLPKSEVLTSRYHYRFNDKNYLVVQNIDLLKNKTLNPFIDGSTFYLKADLKYFLTISINQSDIESTLEAYKAGPIRAITRVTFTYKFLRLNFNLGMYTEVSFFGNSVILPAIIDNPLDAKKNLNEGSIFYYGLSLIPNPKDLTIDNNMQKYKEKAGFNFFKSDPQPDTGLYWIQAKRNEEVILIQITPSLEMRRDGAVPMLYVEDKPGSDLKSRTKNPAPLGKSPVNVAVALDLSGLSKGTHTVAFTLFVENKATPEMIQDLINLNQWGVKTKRLPLVINSP